jgi:hypothetical protein
MEQKGVITAISIVICALEIIVDVILSDLLLPVTVAARSKAVFLNRRAAARSRALVL